MNQEASEYQTSLGVKGPLHEVETVVEEEEQYGDIKSAFKALYKRRQQSDMIAFEKLSSTDQDLLKQLRRTKSAKKKSKLRRKKLDPHVFEEAFGFVGDRLNDVGKIKREADFALEIARIVNNVKEKVRYPGSNYENLKNNSISRLEDLIAFIAGISTCGSILNFLALLHLYLRTYFPEPMTIKIMDLVRDNFGIAKEYIKERAGAYGWSSQSGEETIDGIEGKFAMFKSLISDWKVHKSCDFTKHACNLVNILVTFGFFPNLKENPLEINGFRLFQAKVWDIQKNSFDFIEVILDTATFFLERGYMAISQGDYTLLMYEDDETLQLEKEYVLLTTALPLLEAGKLDGLEKYDESIRDQQDFEVRLEKLNATFSGILKTEKSPYVRNTITNKLVVLSKVRTALIMCQKSSCIREKPFGVLIHGGSAVGKSMVNSIVLKVLLSANNFNSTKEHVVTLNDSDKFQSEYRAHHTAVTMDDFGNTKAEHYDGSPTNKIIDFLNNVPKAALNPNVELKGNVMIQPKIVTVTTNVKTLMAGTFSNEPVSILRRFNIVLDVHLRKEWTDPETGGPDEEKMHGKFCPDAWVINVERVEIVRCKQGKDKYKFTTIVEDASIFEALDVMKHLSQRHFKSQKAFVKIIEDFYNLELCEHHLPPKECRVCKINAWAEASLQQQCLFEPLGCFDTADPLLLSRVRSELVRPPAHIETLKEIVADWYIERKLHGAVKHVHGACNTIQEALVAHKENILKVVLGGVAVGASVILIQQLYKNFNKLKNQGSEVATPVRIEGDEVSPWKKVEITRIPKTIESASTSHRALVEKISHHIGHAFLIDEEKQTRRRCDIMPMCKNFWLAPSHMFEDKEYTIQVQTTPKDVLGKNPTQKIGPENWVRIPDTDFVLVCLTSGGDVADFGKFLPTGEHDFSGTVVQSIFKSPEGEVDIDQFKLLGTKKIESKSATFLGATYHYPRPTFEGLCMMALVTCTVGPVIAGFHLAGKTGQSLGAAGHLTKTQLDAAIADLEAKGVLSCHSSGDFLTEKYGINYTPKNTTPPSSAVNYLADSDDGVQPIGLVFGEHPLGTRTFKSGVTKSPISDSVTKHMDLPRIHGKPQGMNSWVHWQRDLSLMAIPRGNFRPSIMLKARDDFTQMVDKFFGRRPEMLELVHPYSKDCVLAGIDGVNSVDRIDLSTSMGFPVNKQKKNFIHPSERTVLGISCPLEIDDQFWSEVERMENELAEGRRVFTVFRGNLKDEPVKFTKKKVRVFAGCEFAFLALTRKYFLSIIRVIQSNWVDFECAVGINAHGSDWTRLAEVLTKYGSERMIAGDYAAFDKSAAPEAMLAAFDQLIKIAAKAGYTERQLTIMRGIATEICLPVYELDGVLLQTFGSNPSGHPLTVIINNIMNSIYLRYTYYVIHENDKDVPLFSDVIALMCYGDDNAMGVDEREKDFNHTRVSHELAKVGIKYTMADKEAESIPYIPFSNVSFLKRSFVYNEDVGEYFAPLEVASISKSLHNYMKRRGSDVLPEKTAADAILNAQREFLRHGRNEYTIRMEQLGRVVQECDLLGYVGELPTYDEAIEKYLIANSKVKTPISEEPDTIRFD